MPVTVQVKIENLPELKERLKQAPGIAEPIFQKAVVGSQDILAKYTIGRNSGGPVPWITGNLTVSFRRQSGRLWARWFPTAPYAIYVHQGSGPRTITPKNKKALFWPGAKHPVRSVRHPGTKPNPFMEKILSNAAPEINKMFADALDSVTKKIANA